MNRDMQLTPLSEQNLIDCDTDNHGCKGGDVLTALKFVSKNGISFEESYPYDQRARSYCQPNRKTNVMRNLLPAELPNEVDTLKRFLVNYGPVAIFMESDDFMNYKSGIFSSQGCKGILTHAMLLVGYGTSNDGYDYWIVVSIRI